MLLCNIFICLVLLSVKCSENLGKSTVGQNHPTFVYSSVQLMGGDERNITTEAAPGVSTSKSGERIDTSVSTFRLPTDKGVNEHLWLNDMCSMYATCEYVSQLTFKYCRCDEECYVYKDCCYNGADSKSVVAISSNFTFDCIQYNTRSKYIGTYVVTRCQKLLSHFGNETFCNDDDIMKVGPWVVDADGRIFKNKYCAYCNGIFSFESLPVEFSNIDSNLFIVFKNKNISLTERMKILFYNIDIEHRYIIPDRSRECLITEPNSISSEECQQYAKSPVAEVFFRPLIYRNMYCVKPENRGNGNIICVAIIHGLFDSLTDTVFPLTVLFSFEEESKGICSEEQQQIVCPSSAVYNNLEVEAIYNIVANDSVTADLLTQVAFSFLWAMSIQNYTTGNSLRLWYNVTVSNIFVILTVNVHKQLKSFDEIAIQESLIRNVKWKNIITTKTKVIMFYIDEPIRHFDPQGESRVFLSWRFKNSMDVETKMLSYLNTSTNPIEETNCKEIQMKSVHISDMNRLSINDIVCVKTYRRRSTHKTNQHTLTIYLTYTGCSLSVITLLVSVVICRKYDITSSIHGSNLENLSIVLMLAIVLFLVGIGAHNNQLVCNIVGVILHYLWLAVFSFMSVAIVVLVHGITTISNPSNKQNSSRWSSLLGGSIPLLLVIPAIICHVFEVQNLEPNYGGLVCFPTGFPANLVFVSGPIMLSVMINTVCLVVLVIYIARIHGEAKRLRKSHSYQQIEVYLRVSVLTGIFWTTGIISSLVKNEVLDYIFVITCSFQGFFIALANITTRRVCRQMRPFQQSLSTGSTHAGKQLTRCGGSSSIQEQRKEGETTIKNEVTSKEVYHLPIYLLPTNVPNYITDTGETINHV